MQVDNSKDLDVTMYKYAKTSGSLWQYQMITQQILNHLNLNQGSYTILTMRVLPYKWLCHSLKYLVNFCRIHEMPSINCKINFIITCSANSIDKYQLTSR